MFLTPEDLHVLTGYKQYTRQIAFLKRQGIPFRVNAAGHPVVAEQTLYGSRAPEQKKTWEPVWSGGGR